MSEFSPLVSNSPNIRRFYKCRKKDTKTTETITILLEIENKEGSSSPTKWKSTISTGDLHSKSTVEISNETNETDQKRIYLIALIDSLEWIKNNNQKNVIIFVNNVYVVNCVSEWISRWERSDFYVEFIEKDDCFEFVDRRERPNADLLRRIASLRKMCKLKLQMRNLNEENSSERV